MPGQRDHDPNLRDLARQMRAEPSDAERQMWRLLRDRRLSQFKFRRQVPISGYIADFYCVKLKVVVELDGGQHLEPDALAYDRERTATFNRLGVRVVRFNTRQVLREGDAVCATLLRDLSIMPSPQPSPGVPGEGADASTSDAACRGPNASYVRPFASPP